MYMIDQPNAVSRVIGQINALKQSLWGNGVPPVSARGAVDGTSLVSELQILKEEIDKFLKKV